MNFIGHKESWKFKSSYPTGFNHYFAFDESMECAIIVRGALAIVRQRLILIVSNYDFSIF